MKGTGRWTLLLLAAGILTGGIFPPVLASETELPEIWRAWQFARPLEGLPDPTAELVRVPLDLDVLIGAQPELVDLRVIDGSGAGSGIEVPFLVQVSQGSVSRSWREARVSDLGFVPGRFTEVLVDLGAEGLLHNSVELRTGEDDFFTWVSIATSEDRRDWKIVRPRAPAYRFRADDLEGNRVLSYPESRARWLRLHILDARQAFALDDVRVAYEVKEPTLRLEVSTRLRRLEDPTEGRSGWVVDLGGAVPISGVRFRAEAGEFHRPVIVRSSADGEAWSRAGQGDVYRQQRDEPEDSEEDRFLERLEVELSERWARFWSIEVVDRDDRPVEGLVPELLTTHREVIFRPEARQDYRLLYGNPQAKAARYDLARVTTRKERDGAAPARLGDRLRNTAYLSGEPWTERHPILLWLALGAAVAILGGVALRTLK